MLGYCGINCDQCPGYRGTVNTDQALLEEAARTYQQGAYTAEEWVCLGCLPADQAILARSCAECRVRACAVARGVQNCAACAEFEECPLLRDLLQEEGEAVRRRMQLLRQRFLER
jgi:hypothetical protein